MPIAGNDQNGSEFIRFVWPAVPSRLPEIRRSVRGWLEGLDLPGERVDNLLLAICEAVGNVIRHAYGTASADRDVWLVGWVEDGSLNVEVRDRGVWRGGPDPSSGLGIELMRSLVDSVSISYGRPGTYTRFRQALGR